VLPAWSSTVRSILLIDDDEDFSGTLTQLLEGAGYAVASEYEGRAGAAAALESHPDVVLLDLSMPGFDGWQVLDAIRRQGPLPAVLVLSAYTRASDTVRALRMGADDYITKPFSNPDLLARVGSAARRSHALRETTHPAELTFGPLVIDLNRREVACDGAPVALTKSEYELLVALVADPNRVFTRRQLVDRVWGPDWFGDDHAIDMHVSRLRRKLGEDVLKPRFIETVRGVGFRMAPPIESAGA